MEYEHLYQPSLVLIVSQIIFFLGVLATGNLRNLKRVCLRIERTVVSYFMTLSPAALLFYILYYVSDKH